MIHKRNLKCGRRLNRKWRSTPHNKMENIGIPTGLLDKFRREIMSGDKVRIDPDYEGIVLYDRNYTGFVLFYGLWYGEKNPYDADCYGKVLPIPKDNGMRMKIEILNEYSEV